MMTFTQYGKIFVNALLAGLFIGMAGTVYLAVPNANLGAFLFAFALMTILCYGFKLFTGAIGYLVTQKRGDVFSYLITLVLIWLGNLCGCFAVGTLVRNTRSFALINERVTNVCNAKLMDNPVSLLILAFFCGILMYLAVETYRRKELGDIFRFAAVFLCVAIFILCGFEHCIANMYYFSVAGMWSVNTLLSVLLMTLGNSLGGWLLPLAAKLRN
jgi:formate/nitrite transporter FocA (FNT family)